NLPPSFQRIECVAPSLDFLRAAFNTMARKLGVSRQAFVLRWLLLEPAYLGQIALFQRMIGRFVISNRSRMATNVAPSANNKSAWLARHTLGSKRDCAMLSLAFSLRLV